MWEEAGVIYFQIWCFMPLLRVTGFGKTTEDDVHSKAATLALSKIERKKKKRGCPTFMIHNKTENSSRSKQLIFTLSLSGSVFAIDEQKRVPTEASDMLQLATPGMKALTTCNKHDATISTDAYSNPQEHSCLPHVTHNKHSECKQNNKCTRVCFFNLSKLFFFFTRVKMFE